jgi:hypothetical protein
MGECGQFLDALYTEIPTDPKLLVKAVDTFVNRCRVADNPTFVTIVDGHLLLGHCPFGYTRESACRDPLGPDSADSRPDKRPKLGSDDDACFTAAFEALRPVGAAAPQVEPWFISVSKVVPSRGVTVRSHHAPITTSQTLLALWPQLGFQPIPQEKSLQWIVVCPAKFASVVRVFVSGFVPLLQRRFDSPFRITSGRWSHGNVV